MFKVVRKMRGWLEVKLGWVVDWRCVDVVEDGARVVDSGLAQVCVLWQAWVAQTLLVETLYRSLRLLLLLDKMALRFYHSAFMVLHIDRHRYFNQHFPLYNLWLEVKLLRFFIVYKNLNRKLQKSY